MTADQRPSTQSATPSGPTPIRRTFRGALTTVVAVGVALVGGVAFAPDLAHGASQLRRRHALIKNGDTVTNRSELDLVPGTLDTDTLNPEGQAKAWDVANDSDDPRFDYGYPQYGDPQRFGVPGGARSAISAVVNEKGEATGRMIVVRPLDGPDSQPARTEIVRIDARRESPRPHGVSYMSLVSSQREQHPLRNFDSRHQTARTTWFRHTRPFR